MKRVKMMLLSFALLAVVGGALAFKAKFQLFDYCTTTTDGGNTLNCQLIQARTTSDNIPQVSYTTAVEHPLTGEIGCTTAVPGNNAAPISCTVVTTITTDAE